MSRVEISRLYADCDALAGSEVTVSGWVRTIRDSKSIGFVELNDGSCLKGLQIVLEEDKLPAYKEIVKTNVGAAVTVRGKLALTPNMKQPFELHACEVTVEGPSTPDYPLQKKRHSMEYLRTIAHLRPRTNTFNALYRVRSTAAFAIHRFFQERGFIYAHTPLITGSDCEGAGEMFRVTTLDRGAILPANAEGAVDYQRGLFRQGHEPLTVSGQLAAECDGAWRLERCYTFGPTFRAERSFTHPPRGRVLDDRAGDGISLTSADDMDVGQMRCSNTVVCLRAGDHARTRWQFFSAVLR